MCLAGGGDLLFGLSSLSESVLESSGEGLHVFHTSRSNGTTALCLLSPIEVPHLLIWVTTRRTKLLLDVVRNLTAAATAGVRLVMPLSEWGGTLGLLIRENIFAVVFKVVDEHQKCFRWRKFNRKMNFKLKRHEHRWESRNFQGLQM